MSEVCVRVAVRVRPLLPREVLRSHRVCVRVVPGSSRVMLGSDRLFHFDHAFGPAAAQGEVYESCVRPLVESWVEGFNVTVFCYGQTGSGKTYTLGGGKMGDESGIIDCVAQDVFLLLGEKEKGPDSKGATVRVSYMELYKEELRDLLELHTTQKELHIRENERGHTVVIGAKEMIVTSAEELLSVLEIGSALRHTSTTGMNEHSSRSHTILTLQLTRRCPGNSSSDEVHVSKLCLVDLAGSERAGKTGNTGIRLKESAHINTGLLALGNVIRALSDPSRNRRGNNPSSAHIPYRDAKITRLLRDSLGGTAHTLMMACVSPSHHNVAETLSVLHFASKARHIRNRPRATYGPAEVKSCPTAWDPGEARLGELEYEVQTLRELLKEREREMEMDKAGENADGKYGSKLSIQTQANDVDQGEPSQYCALAQEAAVLFAEIHSPSLSQSVTQRVQDWQERLKAVSFPPQTKDKNCLEAKDESQHVALLQLRQELKRCKEAVNVQQQLLEQKNVKLKQAEKEVQRLLREQKTQLQILEQEKKNTCTQTQQIVDQQILIDCLRNDLMALTDATSASGNSDKRPQSVPLIKHSSAYGLPRRLNSSPPAYSLERVMGAFKMRGHLLLAEIEAKDEVYCPFQRQEIESKDWNQEEKESFVCGNQFRHSLNRTWTSSQKNSALGGKVSGLNRTANGIEPNMEANGAKDLSAQNCSVMHGRLKTAVTRRQIQALSVNMRIKQDLIKELDKTVKETQALGRYARSCGNGREFSLFAKLSTQSQESKAVLFRSLQQMRLQRVQLQDSLRHNEETTDIKTFNYEGVDDEKLIVCNSILTKGTQETESSCWLEDAEEQLLQRRAEIKELDEELRRREEVLLHREACLLQKNKLEIKKLSSSQALGQDLLHVSLWLESLEDQLRSCSGVRKTRHLATEEVEKERDMLQKKKDALDAQLKDNRALTVEEEQSLLQVEEAIEVLDAALEFRNHSIKEKQEKLSVPEFAPCGSQNSGTTHVCHIIKRLRQLSPPEATELLVKYFNKVVSLQETERHLHLRCKELELHAGEKEVLLKEREAAMQRLALDADLRLTQQQRDHQNNIQLLLQKLKRDCSQDSQQDIRDRLQNLEKELFFYKSSSRQLKKKLRELLGDALDPPNKPLHPQEQTHTDTLQIHAGTNKPQMCTEEAGARIQFATTYPKTHNGKKDQKTHNDAQMENVSPLAIDLQTHSRNKMPAETQIYTLTQSQGKSHCEECLVMTPARLCRKDLKQISPADLQVCGSATRRHQSVDSSSETLFEDSIELSGNNDR